MSVDSTVDPPSKISGDPKNSGRLAGLESRAREGAAGKTAGYSNFVGFMRYAVPTVAAFLLGLVVIWPLVTGREDGFRISFTDSGSVDSSLSMVNARYIGTDDRNRPYTITAARANQPDPDAPLIELQTITADMFAEAGNREWMALTANEGLYQRDERWLDLIGSVTFFSDAGHQFRTERAHIDLATGTAEGEEALSGQAPFGLLHAGSFRFINKGDTMFFGDGVKLTVFPGKRG